MSGGRNASLLFDNRETTPNASRLMQATPSKVQPSPTVHTKEALGKKMHISDQLLNIWICLRPSQTISSGPVGPERCGTWIYLPPSFPTLLSAILSQGGLAEGTTSQTGWQQGPSFLSIPPPLFPPLELSPPFRPAWQLNVRRCVKTEQFRWAFNIG